MEGRFDRWRASYASDPSQSRGRLKPEPASPTRSDFQRDRDRILHSTAFRRLKHKTQVFVFHEGDHFRTRLTHTLEVSQIARSIARALGLDEDLAEALALSHDLGHPPFGHAGEDALDVCLEGHGGFDHNAQAIRIVTRLERRYPDFDGLNLTWETIEGLVKHNGPLLEADGTPVARYRKRGLPADFIEANHAYRLAFGAQSGPEAQVAALADDIAYNTHDIDDGLRAGLFSTLDLKAVPFLAEILEEIDALWPGLETPRVIHELGRRHITRFVEGVIAEGQARLAPFTGKTVEAIRAANAPVIAFPTEFAEADRDIKRFLYAHMYRTASVLRVRKDAEVVVKDLFERFVTDPGALPAEWQSGLSGVDATALHQRVADYIAGMTDRFALDEHRRLFDATPELR